MYNNYCKHNSGAIYNSILNTWECANCGKIIKPNDEQTRFKEGVDNSSQPVKRCDCGAEKAKTTHARYCTLYKE